MILSLGGVLSDLFPTLRPPSDLPVSLSLSLSLSLLLFPSITGECDIYDFTVLVPKRVRQRDRDRDRQLERSRWNEPGGMVDGNGNGTVAEGVGGMCVGGTLTNLFGAYCERCQLPANLRSVHLRGPLSAMFMQCCS